MDIRVNASSENDLDLRTAGESSYGGNTNITRSLHPKQTDGNAEIIYRCALNRKKRDRSSPFQSPKQITRSPAPKKGRRPRTGTEQPTEQVESNPTSSYQFVHACTENTSVTKNVSDFLLNDQETSALNEFHEEIHTYMMQKLALESNESPKTFLNLQDYLSLTRTNYMERSNVLYLDVMDAK